MEFMELISSFGFPVACVGALGLFLKSTLERDAKENTAREDKLFNTIAEQEAEYAQMNSDFVNVLKATTEKIEHMQEDINDIKAKLGIE